MKKNFMTLIAIVSFSTIAYSQVGINTETPKATLDVVASPDDANKIDGVIAPRLTGDKLQSKNGLYGPEQEGTIIYATSPSSEAGNSVDKTKNVDAPGYYYFDGEFWVKMTTNENIYVFKALKDLTVGDGLFDFNDNNFQEGITHFEFRYHSGSTGIDFPAASDYKGRIITIKNSTQYNINPHFQESQHTNQNIIVIGPNRAVMFASDGERWYSIAGVSA